MRKLLQFFCSLFLTVHVFAADPIPSDLVGEWRTTTSRGDDYGALYVRSDGFAMIMGSKPVPIGAGGPVAYDSNTRTLMLSLREGGAELARLTFLHKPKTGLLTTTMNGTTMSYQHLRKELPSDVASADFKVQEFGGFASQALAQETIRSQTPAPNPPAAPSFITVSGGPHPGRVAFKTGIKLLEALAAVSGGDAAYDDMTSRHSIRLVRGGKSEIFILNRVRAHAAEEPVLQAGDVIMFAEMLQ